jgi:sugar phosphate isomerase/epimerase
MAWWDACIDAHVQAGVKYIVQPFMGNDAFESLDALKKYCKYFNAVGEKCKAKGIIFGYHNHEREFETIDGQVIFDFMLQNTDPSKVFFQIDLWWAYVGGANPNEYFATYPDRFILWHVKDEKEVGGSGKMDFESIFDGARKSGMQHVIVEAEEYTVSAMDGVRKSYDFLKAAKFVK